jgi:hypothetical protein
MNLFCPNGARKAILVAILYKEVPFDRTGAAVKTVPGSEILHKSAESDPHSPDFAQQHFTSPEIHKRSFKLVID